MMEEEVVRRRRWMSRERFLDLLAASNLIPGPSSTEMGIYIGHLRAGWPGLVVAGVCFIAPAMLLTLALAWAYSRYGSLPQAEAVLHGVKPVIIAVVAQALWSLGRAAMKTRWLAAVALGAGVASALGASPVVVLLAAGAATLASRRLADPGAWSAVGLARASLPAALAAPFGLPALFLVFLKIGLCSSAAATSCLPSCAPSSSTSATGSPRHNSSTRWRPAR